MNNGRLLLIWHPTQSPQHPNLRPSCVKLWIESGVYLVDGSFLLPKLSWISTSSTEGFNKLNSGTAGASIRTKAGKKTALPPHDPETLELLDICRLRGTDDIDRAIHPFADARRSFTIRTPNQVYLFEAPTPEERDRIVYGLKLVVARLASLLMLRDYRAAEEFFGVIAAQSTGSDASHGDESVGQKEGSGEVLSNTVPGAPPSILTGKKQ
jgi:hypothetical protein